MELGHRIDTSLPVFLTAKDVPANLLRLKPGERVRILQPRHVLRVGYRKSAKDFIPEARYAIDMSRPPGGLIMVFQLGSCWYWKDRWGVDHLVVYVGLETWDANEQHHVFYVTGGEGALLRFGVSDPEGFMGAEVQVVQYVENVGELTDLRPASV